jgi:hypothetical protein
MAFAAPPVPLPEPGAEPGVETARAQEAIVALDRALIALAAQTTVLPVRFGAVFADARSLRAAVEDGAAEFAAALERASGAREYRIDISEAAPPEHQRGAAASGREFLRDRRAARDGRSVTRADRTAALGALEDALAQVCLSRAWRPVGSPGRAGLAVLTAPERVPDILDVLSAAEQREPARRFALTGPWPLYSFEGGHLAQTG